MDEAKERPPFRSGAVYTPTDKDRRIVEMMTAAGIPQENICRAIGICVDTLYKNYREELDTAVDKANAQVAGSLFKKAMSENHPGSVTAAIFWLKTRAKWKEPTNLVVSGDEDAPPVKSETVIRWER